ncbi:MAG: hypothetical protein J6S78_07780 [Lachnospiraceae bacterium]|nr:hypothetical protein [Lachnospiraceae bacterium]
MKAFLKKEAPLFVPSSLMFLIALMMLEMIMFFGVVLKNKGLVSTLIYMFLFTTVIMVVMLLAGAGKALLTHLRDENYYSVWKAQGDTALTLFGKLTGLYTVILFALTGLYLLAFGLDVLWSSVAFPDEKEGLSKLWDMLFPGPNGAAAVAATVLEFMMIAFLFTALTFFAVTMAYNLFTKTRYAGFLGAVFFAIFAYTIVKINVQVLSSLGTVTYHLASAGFCAVCGIVLSAVTYGSIRKREWNSDK